MKYLIIIGLLALSFKSSAQTEKFKSLFMYKFLQGVEWPSGKTDKKYVVAVLGDQKIIDNLKIIAKGRNVNGKPIEVVEYVPGGSLGNIAALFVAHKKRDLFESILKKAIMSSTLLIMESPGFAEKGALFNFINSQGRLKFEINMASCEEARLKVSTTVSSLGIQVN